LQLDLVLINFKDDNPKQFCYNLCISPNTFDSLVKMIEDHPVFLNTLCNSQNPVRVQLAIRLFQFGHDRNTATIEAITQWAGISASTIVNCMCRVMVSFLTLYNFVVHWTSEDEKEEAQSWVESV
jgi:hypothetical protein